MCTKAPQYLQRNLIQTPRGVENSVSERNEMKKTGEPKNKAFVVEMSGTLFYKENYEMTAEFWFDAWSGIVHASNHGTRRD
jgi:hypothetical protein